MKNIQQEVLYLVLRLDMFMILVVQKLEHLNLILVMLFQLTLAQQQCYQTRVTKDVKFKHFLFDIEMFAHVNVGGVMSGALTTGDKLTGGTSGATGIVESVTTEGSATITGASSSRSCCSNNV